jgi:hypothetical protein
MHHSNFGSFMHSLDNVREEPESEVQVEQAQAEAQTNLALDQGKPRCIPPIVLGFSLITIFMSSWIVHYVYWS